VAVVAAVLKSSMGQILHQARAGNILKHVNISLIPEG